MAGKEPVAAQPYHADDATATPWVEARARLEDGDWYWLATVRQDGLPHVVPLLAVWADGSLHFAASPSSRKARNLSHDAHCVITVGSDALHLVVEGEAGNVRDEFASDRRRTRTSTRPARTC